LLITYIKRIQALIVTKKNRLNIWPETIEKKKLPLIINYNKMKEISVQELKEKMDNGEDFQLIDVREDFEYETSNLGGLLIPLGGILIESDKIEKDKPVVIMCRSGKRSAAAIMQLEQQGFTNLYNLYGGILAWAEDIDPTLSVY
jgi:rhodanese-related sulfurtransferase